MLAPMTLEELGWNAAFEKEFAPFYTQGWQPARLIRDNKITYGALLASEPAAAADSATSGSARELEVIMSGKVYHDAETDAELPAVGDWVALDVGGEGSDHVIRARLKRQTCLSRKIAGNSTEEQVIAANVNVVVVVTDADADFSLRRMERYFAIIGRSGAKAVVLVNKADLYAASKCRAAAEAIQALNAEADVHVTSMTLPKTLKVLRQYLSLGVSMTFVGSSGVGKSSVINHLLGGDYQFTDEVNEVTGRGRHTTTARELMVLRGGIGIIIDNPGIKEVQMWIDETTLRERFADLEALAAQCKYRDCKHGSDTGCAIQAAMQAGTLDAARFEGFLKLDDEIEKLRRSRKKRQMTVERRFKREEQAKAKKFAKRRYGDDEDEPRERR